MKNSGCMSLPAFYTGAFIMIAYGILYQDTGGIIWGGAVLVVLLIISNALKSPMPSIDEIETGCHYCDLELVEGATYKHNGTASCGKCGKQHSVNVHVVYEGLADGYHQFRTLLPKTCECGTEMHALTLLCGHSRPAKIAKLYKMVHHWQGTDEHLHTFTDPWGK